MWVLIYGVGLPTGTKLGVLRLLVRVMDVVVSVLQWTVVLLYMDSITRCEAM